MVETLVYGSLVTRRSLLVAAGLTASATTLTTAFAPARAGATEPAAVGAGSHPVDVPRVGGLHTQFGSDASRQVTVSWQTPAPVHGARVLIARDGSKYERTVPAAEASYTDAKSGQVIYAYHAQIRGLRGNTCYLYAAAHDGAAAELGSFQTAPRGRSPFVFTSFGDQGTPTLGRAFVPPPGVTLPNPPFVNDNLGSPAAGDTTAGVERVAPLFHLFNGDLCYANLADDRVRTWSDFWENNSRSARHRPWMPAAGNHENELGNGPIGYAAYQTYFHLPAQDGQTDITRGLWYSFTVGAVRFISLANDDICYQDGGNSYVRGYSGGAQQAWLEAELQSARADRDIDWIVVCMHQVAISSTDGTNGADLGIRQDWLPLFDRYGVDLVVCGHEHHYERSHPIRGQQPNPTLTPIPAGTRTDIVDTSQGTVHMILGGGGTSAPTNQKFFDPPQCRVITAVGAPDPTTGKRPSVFVTEPAPWSARRDAAAAYGFASFTVDPGTEPGGVTSISVTYYEVNGPYGQLHPFETFTLQRHRTDG